MHLAHLRLRDFRNYARLDADFAPGFHLLLGDNAQGKTNVLEAVYLMATLRSFRGVGGAQMVRHGQRGYFAGGTVVGGSIPAFSLSSPKGGEGQGEEAPISQVQNPSPRLSPRTGREREKKILTSYVQHEIKMFWSVNERKLALDGQAVKKLADYFGVLRAVVFCTEDVQLVKGAARTRRRFLDLLLAQTHPGYLPLLQRYMRTVRARNALLKQSLLNRYTVESLHSSSGPTLQRFNASTDSLLESFSRELIGAGDKIIQLRRELVPKFSPLARLAYRRISNDAEELRIEYRPGVKKDFAVELAQSRSRERTYRATLIGPHRDDLQLLLNGRSAAQFASEGQKRTLAIALKMAQAEYLAGIHGTPPVLLIDDVMGELDVKRRSGFLPLLERARKTGGQVFMTATEENWPRELGGDLQRWEVHAGNLKKF